MGHPSTPLAAPPAPDVSTVNNLGPYSQQPPAQTQTQGQGHWNSGPTSTLQYTQSMQQPTPSDIRTHPGYRKFIHIESFIL
jgi:hypothetical protein